MKKCYIVTEYGGESVSYTHLDVYKRQDIDHRRCATISWMIDNLDIKECSCPCKVDPETKKVIKLRCI